MKFWRI